MDPANWRRIEALFLECMALDGDARRRRLEAVADADLRAVVSDMLRADAGAEDALRLAVGVAAERAARARRTGRRPPARCGFVIR